MIASLTGVVRAASREQLVVDVNGVGYAVNVTNSVASAHEIGDPIDLLTTLIVREDSMSLFGFLSSQDLQIFESLITVSGVGPKSALGVLSALSPAEVLAAVTNEDESAFKAVSGIGPKTAKLIIVSLGGRLSAVVPTQEQAPSSSHAVNEQVVTALVGLGWQDRVAREAVAAVNAQDSAPVAEVLRLTLASLAQVQR